MKHIPNILTIFRLLACPLIIYLFIFGTVMSIFAKKILIVFVIASLTDFFDGYLARKGNFKSNFGKILDPIADKALIITMFVMIIIYGDFNKYNEIALYIIILRELTVSSLRFNLNSVNESIDVNLLSKYKTFIQMLAIGFYMLYECQIGHENILYSISIFLIWIAAFITFATGIQHFKTYLKLKQK